MKQLVTVPKNELEHILKTEEIDAYFYWDYWEYAGANFDFLKTYPVGTLSADKIETELNALYEEYYNLFDEYKNRFGNSVTTLFYIGYFDDTERNFHVIAWKGKEDEKD